MSYAIKSTRNRISFLLLGAILAGALIFARGFLRIRKSIVDKSVCNQPPAKPLFGDNIGQEDFCWLPYPSKKKAVLIVIDALRTDFVLPAKFDANHKDDALWVDKLTIMAELAEKEPERANLFYFVADPPTATTQRLSGIAAGTLPAFIEVAASFSESTLGSDNFIYQLLQADRFRNLHMYGDDTWLSLFPIIKERSLGKIAGYHSFHLFDLHTVDNHIKDDLFPTLESGDFSFIVAHFLGVDHCGHKHGPTKAPCGEKLEEMDGVIRKIISSLDKDTTLLIMGDHGMTDNGDHGGNTPKEVSTVLFSYSKSLPNAVHNDHAKLFLSKINNLRSREILGIKSLEDEYFSDRYSTKVLKGSVGQIDFAPTISLLTGLPIPYSNIGAIIPELLVDWNKSWEWNIKFLVDAVRMNAFQIKNALIKNSLLGESGFSAKEIQPLLDDLEFAESIEGEDDKVLEEKFFEFYKFTIHAQQHFRKVWANYDTNSIFIGVIIGVTSALALFLVQKSHLSVSTLLVLLHMGSLGATSFITFESNVVLFFLGSLNLLLMFKSGGALFSSKKFKTGILINILIRLMAYSGICREEQFPYCQLLSHRDFSAGLNLQTLAIICALIFGTMLSLYSLKTLQISTIFLDGLLLIRWIWVWGIDSGLNVKPEFINNCFDLYLPRSIIMFSIIKFLLTCRRNPTLSIKSIAALAGLVQRPLAGWILNAIGVPVIIFSRQLLEGIDPMTSATFYYLLGLHLFFITGHQSTITNLQWEAAFIGFHSTSQLIGGLLMTLNTFAGPILTCLALSYDFPESIISYLTICSVKVIATSIYLGQLMYHLMVWKMFTPRFLLQLLLTLINIFILTFHQKSLAK